MKKDKLMKELHELLYRTSCKFVKKHKLSIQSIKMDSDFTTIIENVHVTDDPFTIKTYRISNEKINKEQDNG